MSDPLPSVVPVGPDGGPVHGTGIAGVGPSGATEVTTEADMLIDCNSCAARDLACDDCVVTALLGPLELGVLPEAEQRALAVLADSGLVPPLRLLPQPDPGSRQAG